MFGFPDVWGFFLLRVYLMKVIPELYSAN